MAEEKKQATEAKEKTPISEEKLEVLIAILLGVTAILTAWAGWVGSLHGGNQATNYTQSNNLSSMGNSMYNEAAQDLMQDMLLWNTIYDYAFDAEIAELNNKPAEAELIQTKIETLIQDNCSERFAEAIDWALAQEEDVSPFDMEGYVEGYFADANAVLEEADGLLEQGKTDNANGDAYGLVTVIYSLVLFLLGIVGIFKKIPNRVVILVFAGICLVLATVYMITIPMSFFQH